MLIIQSFALASEPSSVVELSRLDSLIDSGLQTIVKLQKKEDNAPEYWKGEWGSIKQNIKSIIYLGPKGKAAYDSNAFTTGNIHNELAELLLRNPDKLELLSTPLKMAYDNLQTFMLKPGEYTFWHRLPLTEKMKAYVPSQYHSMSTFRPNQYELINNFTARRSHVPADADDTSLVYSAQSLREKLATKYPESFDHRHIEMKFDVFNQYKDKDRNRVHPINKLVGNFKNTGAYLTWFSHKENGFYKGMNIEWDDEPRIPFSVNDVDCVVNANVLQSLARHEQQEDETAKNACKYIERAIDKGLSHRCGVYYPSPFYLHYSVAKAYAQGANCLEGSAKKLEKELLEKQNPDGSWGWVKKPKSTRKRHLNAPVPSTIYAFSALLSYSNKLNHIKENEGRLHKTAAYILEKAQTNNGLTQWEEGVFFSGGGFVRRVLVWKSVEFTTTLAVTGLDYYKHTFYSKEEEEK